MNKFVRTAGYPQPTARTSTVYSPYIRMPGQPPNLTSDLDLKQEVKSIIPSAPPTLQELEAERSVRRARRNRTCFTREQVKPPSCILKEIRPDTERYDILLPYFIDHANKMSYRHMGHKDQ